MFSDLSTFLLKSIDIIPGAFHFVPLGLILMPKCFCKILFNCDNRLYTHFDSEGGGVDGGWNNIAFFFINYCKGEPTKRAKMVMNLYFMYKTDTIQFKTKVKFYSVEKYTNTAFVDICFSHKWKPFSLVTTSNIRT